MTKTRDEKGRFIKGQSGNPKGRSTFSDEEKYADVYKSKVTPNKFAEVVDQLLFLAIQRRDMNAIKLLMAYAMGQPVQKSEVSGTEGGPLEIIVRYANQTASGTNSTE